MSKSLTQDEMYFQSFKRPKNFFKLSSEKQWEIDKRLGILDWEAKDLTVEQLKKISDHYK